MTYKLQFWQGDFLSTDKQAPRSYRIRDFNQAGMHLFW